jgi:hypothetical protein
MDATVAMRIAHLRDEAAHYRQLAKGAVPWSGWALLLALCVVGCGDLLIEPPRSFFSDSGCGTCDRENGR